jgi:DNA replication factor GINS
MSDNSEEYFTLEMAYNILLKEYQISSLQEIPYDTYQRLAITIGNLKAKEYDLLEKRIVQKIIENLSIISNLLLQIRIEKILKGNINSNLEIGYSKMTDEEKFIIDGEIQSKRKRKEIMTLITNGQPKILEKITDTIKQKKLLIMFIKPMEQFVGVDMYKYGPFKVEDVANLPFENALSLVNNKIATEIAPIFD